LSFTLWQQIPSHAARRSAIELPVQVHLTAAAACLSTAMVINTEKDDENPYFPPDESPLIVADGMRDMKKVMEELAVSSVMCIKFLSYPQFFLCIEYQSKRFQ
jgi:hypothetical protein